MQFLEFVLNFIYPPQCGVCGKIGSCLCKKCEIELEKIHIAENRKNTDLQKYYDEVFYHFSYTGIIRDKIIAYKFLNQSYLFEMFVKIMLKKKKTFGFFEKYDIIIPVPISRKRLYERGYNQSELIAKKISNCLSIKMEKNVLIKVKDNIPQSNLDKKTRKENVKDVYEIRNTGIIKNKKILLIDDIYTTGSTVNECSRILKENGAKYIGVMTIAKD